MIEVIGVFRLAGYQTAQRAHEQGKGIGGVGRNLNLLFIGSR